MSREQRLRIVNYRLRLSQSGRMLRTAFNALLSRSLFEKKATKEPVRLRYEEKQKEQANRISQEGKRVSENRAGNERKKIERKRWRRIAAKVYGARNHAEGRKRRKRERTTHLRLESFSENREALAITVDHIPLSLHFHFVERI